MTLGVRLADEDRERLGCPEVLNCSIDDLTILDVLELESQTGYAIETLIDDLEAKPVLDDQGTQKVSAEGKPLFRRNWKAYRPLVWLGLRKAGIQVPYAELDFKIFQAQLEAIDDTPAPGKGESIPVSESEPSAT